MDEGAAETAEIWKDDEGIIHMVATGVPSTAQSVDRNLRLAHRLAGGEPAPILFHAQKWPYGDAESWRRFIDLIESVCSAAAVVMGESNRSKMGKFPELLDALVVPFRVFSDEASAMDFLRSYKR